MTLTSISSLVAVIEMAWGGIDLAPAKLMVELLLMQLEYPKWTACGTPFSIRFSCKGIFDTGTNQSREPGDLKILHTKTTEYLKFKISWSSNVVWSIQLQRHTRYSPSLDAVV